MALIEMLGSGIQQIVALVARLLVSHATFVAIEEPELNLRYTLQMRLWEILHEIVKAPVGPQQIKRAAESPNTLTVLKRIDGFDVPIQLS